VIWADIVVMSLRNLLAIMLLLKASWGVAQAPPARIYTLISGSQLIDDCPICGRIPIVAPLAGTFGLQLLDQSPLATRYDLLNISFHATSGPPYQVSGAGVYQVGGEVAVTQELFLNTEISNGFTSVNALCMSTTGAVTQPWPKIQVQVDQTNGTPARVFHLTLIAVPAPQVRSITADIHTGDLLLEWEATGGNFQVERASSVGGLYSAVTPITTNASFMDVGALTNSAQFFYRLRPF
jgi:hypothetical protein